uniref:Vomeronasal type-1 receptor n=1 Tax=Panagrolaimus sp. PS1159 TaxID=55785 RepID=A0AC35GH23_9BILA
MVFIVIILHAFSVSAPVPFNEITTNLSPGSLSKDGFGGDTFNTSRIIISFINLFAAIILMIFIKKSNLQSETQKTVANLVKRVLLVQTFLDLGVHAIAFAASLMTKSSASTLLGPYARMFSAFSGLFCCICFARTIQKIKKDKNSITKMTLSSLPSQIKII